MMVPLIEVETEMPSSEASLTIREDIESQIHTIFVYCLWGGVQIKDFVQNFTKVLGVFNTQYQKCS